MGSGAASGWRMYRSWGKLREHGSSGPHAPTARCGCFWVTSSYNKPVTWSSSELPSQLKRLRSWFRSIVNDCTAGPRAMVLLTVVSLQHWWDAAGTHSGLKHMSPTGGGRWRLPVRPPRGSSPSTGSYRYGPLCSSYQEALGQHRQRLTWARTRAPPNRPRTNVSGGRLHTETEYHPIGSKSDIRKGWSRQDQSPAGVNPPA